MYIVVDVCCRTVCVNVSKEWRSERERERKRKSRRIDKEMNREQERHTISFSKIAPPSVTSAEVSSVISDIAS